MSESNPLPGSGPAAQRPPSKNLLDLFAQQAEHLRMQAADHRLNASAAHEAHQAARAEADELTARYQHLLSEVERLQQLAAQTRAELDAKLKQADEHRDQAARHGEAADELLGDAEFCAETITRAQLLPDFAPKCSCALPGAPDFDARRNACPVHHGAPAPASPTETRTDPPPIESLPLVNPKHRGSRKK